MIQMHILLTYVSFSNFKLDKTYFRDDADMTSLLKKLTLRI